MRHDLKQGGQEWLKWRDAGIGASEISAVLGLNPWKSSYQLFLEKTGQVEKFRGNASTRRGNELEPEALEELRRVVGDIVIGECYSHDDLPLKASLDARHGSVIYDVKCPGETQYYNMRDGIPVYYEAQLQQQAMVMRANGIEITEVCLFVYHPDIGWYIKRSTPDSSFAKRIAEMAVKFWRCVEAFHWDDGGYSEIFEELENAKRVEKEAKSARKAIESDIAMKMRGDGVGSIDCDGYKATLTKSGGIRLTIKEKK